MKIVVNTRLLRVNRMDGIGWFTYNTMKRITQVNPAIEFHFLFDSGFDESFRFGENIIAHNLFPPAKHALLNVVWFEWSARRVLKKIQPDLFLSPDGLLCLGWKGKQYGVMHDINFHHHPEYLKFSNRKYYNYFFPRFAAKASRLATVSEYSKRDICQSFGVDTDKVDVVYNGVNAFFRPCDEQTKKNIRDKYSLGKPYFVFVGTLSPRKNVKGLMHAFSLFKKETGADINLVIAGWGMYKAKELQAYKERLGVGADIIFTGRVGNEELNYIVGSSLSLIFVPFFEGFGIPLIEAMQSHVPIIASNVTSIPEVVEDAALLVNPYDSNAIKNAMIEIFGSLDLRQKLIENGKIRKKFFSWEKTADLLWEGVLKAV